MRYFVMGTSHWSPFQRLNGEAEKCEAPRAMVAKSRIFIILLARIEKKIYADLRICVSEMP